MPGTPCTIELTDARLSVETWGAGSPLVCLHGGMGLDSSYLKGPGILGLAGDHRQVLVPDQRGHGASSRCDPRRYTHATWANDIFELCRVLGLDTIALMGHSYGGFIALELAVRHPQLLTHLVLVGTSAGPLCPSPVRVASETELRQQIRDHWPGFFAGSDKHWEVFARLQTSLAPFTAALNDELPRYDLRRRLDAIESPTLLVVGERDPYLEDMRYLDRALAHSHLEVLAGVGHMPFLEAPDSFCQLVDDFLS